MWIFCCGMPRSGSTLQFQITAQLVEEAGLGKRVEWVEPKQFGKLRKQYAGDPGWKVFKNHVCTGKMMKEFQRQNAKGVYCFRDLRDVFVSTMRKYEMTFEQLLNATFLADCQAYYRNWTALPNVLVSKYEELMADLPGEVERIASHLGIKLDAEKARQIAAEYNLERQKKRIADTINNGKLRRGTVESALFDPHTQLHTNHIHAGAVGGWKEVLSGEQAALIESQTQDWLAAHGYELSAAK